MADITRQTSNIFLDRTMLSPMPSLTSSPSLRPHHMTNWPHRKTATTSSEHSWGQPPPYNWRNYQSPAPWSPSTATPLLGDLDRTFQSPYSSKCSSPSMICCTRAPKQWQSWSHSASYGRACKRNTPYIGPYQVLSRRDKTLQLLVHGRPVTVSTDRVKPEYILNETNRGNNPNLPAIATPAIAPPAMPPQPPTKTTRSGHHIYFPVSLQHLSNQLRGGGDVGTSQSN
jgi:hypothetical protein